MESEKQEQMIKKIAKRISEIDSILDRDSVEERKQSALSRIQGNMTAWAEELKLEHHAEPNKDKELYKKYICENWWPIDKNLVPNDGMRKHNSKNDLKGLQNTYTTNNKALEFSSRVLLLAVFATDKHFSFWRCEASPNLKIYGII